MHGCYIEMTATYPVGSVVNPGLALNGLHLDVKGELRVSYPFLRIGVAFRDVSDQSVARLREMVRSLLPAAHLGSSATGKAVNQPPTPTPSAPSLPMIVNPTAALQAMVDFFEVRHTSTQEEFVQLIRKSQSSGR